jgi:hypothetical protein
VADLLLAEADWTTRERVYRRRVEEFLAPHLRRTQAGEAHPVWDFLFRYYSLRPRQLRIWHPGFGVVLGGGQHGARCYLAAPDGGPGGRDGDLLPSGARVTPCGSSRICCARRRAGPHA